MTIDKIMVQKLPSMTLGVKFRDQAMLEISAVTKVSPFLDAGFHENIRSRGDISNMFISTSSC
jgi:hypothetical protein